MRIRKKLFFLGLLLAVPVLLTGCGEQRRHYRAVEKKAVSYYREKYGGRKPKIVDSCKAGNSGLFGYMGVKDRAYKLDDGSWIYWDDEEMTFADTRQAEEIGAAMTGELMEPALEKLGTEIRCSGYTFNRTGYDSFDECVYTGYYDGDIRSFAVKEKPRISDMTVVLKERGGFDHEAAVEAFCKEMAPFASGRATVAVMKEDYAGELPNPAETWFSQRDPDLSAIAEIAFDKGVEWFRQVFVEVLPGVYMTSGEANIVLKEGDITFKEIGTCRDLQKILDEAYYALPVDAEENEGGVYAVHDQRHEERVVFDEPDAPVYEIVMSEKIMRALDSYGRFDVFVTMDRESDEPLKTALSREDKSYSVYTICQNREDEAKYQSLGPGYLCFFGSYHLEALEEEPSSSDSSGSVSAPPAGSVGAEEGQKTDAAHQTGGTFSAAP